jgi:hypothetical protein
MNQSDDLPLKEGKKKKTKKGRSEEVGVGMNGEWEVAGAKKWWWWWWWWRRSGQ